MCAFVFAFWGGSVLLWMGGCDVKKKKKTKRKRDREIFQVFVYLEASPRTNSTMCYLGAYIGEFSFFCLACFAFVTATAGQSTMGRVLLSLSSLLLVVRFCCEYDQDIDFAKCDTLVTVDLLAGGWWVFG